MTKASPKYRRPLNQHQTLLLTTLYKFRFVTSQLITTSQNANHVQVINSRLKILLDQHYIERRYDSSYKIKGKPAVYFLASEGIRYLKDQSFANPKVINALYHDKRRTEVHIQHCLHVFETYIALKRLYPGAMKLYGKSELTGRKGLPATLPDALILIGGNKSQQQYFLDCFEESMSYVNCLMGVKRYATYAESEKWQKATKTPLPGLLMVCETKPLMRRLLRLARKELETSYADVKFLVITRDTLQSAQPNKSIWHDADEAVSGLVALS
jgi:hypothetical protein